MTATIYPVTAAGLVKGDGRAKGKGWTGRAQAGGTGRGLAGRGRNSLGVVQQETGDYPAAAASQQQALELHRDIGHQLGQAYVLNDLGLVQQQTGDYPAAAASHARSSNGSNAQVKRQA